MFICLCNALTHVQLSEAIRDGARRPRDVYVACGCDVHCGGCTRTVLGMIRDSACMGAGIHVGREQ